MISELNDREALELLRRGSLGRLGCCENGQPYVVPINYRFDGEHIYIHSLPGRKIEALRANPRACLQVDEIVDSYRWRSVIAFGLYEEITDEQGRGRVLMDLFDHLPELSPVESRMRPGSPPAIVFRLRVESITGLSEQTSAS
jgi:nitroimidazol reductase NimA-like FMN-containing flavoprotein (pyridoxamine 5'-phosphate oxidase superfamily)